MGWRRPQSVGVPLTESATLLHTDGATQASSHAQKGFSFWVAVAFTVNFIMGAGFLGVPGAPISLPSVVYTVCMVLVHSLKIPPLPPGAFVKAGMLLGATVLVSFTWISNLGKNYFLEVMVSNASSGMHFSARALLTLLPLHPSSSFQGRAEFLATVADKQEEALAQGRDVRDILVHKGDFSVKQRKFEFTDLMSIFVGPNAMKGAWTPQGVRRSHERRNKCSWGRERGGGGVTLWVQSLRQYAAGGVLLFPPPTVPFSSFLPLHLSLPSSQRTRSFMAFTSMEPFGHFLQCSLLASVLTYP
jgi:hypothetical protein